MHSFRATFIAPVFLFVLTAPLTPAQTTPSQPLTSSKSLSFHPGPPLVLQSGSGCASFTLTNTSSGPVPLTLTTGTVTDLISHAAIAGANVTIDRATDGCGKPASTLPASIAPGEFLALKANVSGVTHASAVAVDLFNGNALLGTLSMAETDVPFSLSIEGDNSPDKPILYSSQQPVVLSLKNSDPQAYRVKWELLIDGKSQKPEELTVPAAGSARIFLQPDPNIYLLSDYLHPGTRQAALFLTVASPPGVDQGLLPTRTLPVNLLMQRFGPTGAAFVSYAFAGFLLLCGGILSYVASSVLPNMQKKADLRSRLQGLANRTTSIGDRVDSYLRVLLRLERKRVEAALKDAAIWVPTSSDSLAQIDTTLDTLNKRLTATERLATLRAKHDQVSEAAPPSVTDAIDTLLESAADHLHSFALADTDLNAANTFLGKGQAALDLLDNTDALAKQIAGNVVILRTRIDPYPVEYQADLRLKLPGLFVVLDKARGYDSPANIAPPMFFAIDHHVAAIHLALDYAMVRSSIPGQLCTPSAAGVTDAAAPANTLDEALAHLGESACKRLRDHENALFELLGTLSWRALREASLLVQEMREDTYEEDILAEVFDKPDRAEITLDIHTPRPYLPVFFNIVFKNQRFNDSAAMQRLQCHWTFPNCLEERVWKVYHYFTGSEASTDPDFCAARNKSTQKPALSAASASVPESPDPRNWWQKLLGFSCPHATSLLVYATISPRTPKDAGTMADTPEVPIPPLSKVICLQPQHHREWSRAFAGFLRFAIAFGVALAGLFSGAMTQLNRLDFVPAVLAIVGLGFSADSVKNLLTQSSTSADSPVPPSSAANK